MMVIAKEKRGERRRERGERRGSAGLRNLSFSHQLPNCRVPDARQGPRDAARALCLATRGRFVCCSRPSSPRRLSTSPPAAPMHPLPPWRFGGSRVCSLSIELSFILRGTGSARCANCATTGATSGSSCRLGSKAPRAEGRGPVPCVRACARALLLFAFSSLYSLGFLWIKKVT